MISPKQTNAPRGWPQASTTLSPEVEAKCTGGIYQIDPPTKVAYDFPSIDHKTVPSIQLRCQSLHTKSPDVICCCNSVVKTIVGPGSGDQTELIECGKCRTSYLVRTVYDENGQPDVRVRIYDVSRNLKNHVEVKRDSDYNVWVSFNNVTKK